MDKLALLQSEQAFPFVDYMKSAGMPAAKYLEQAKLPVSLLNHETGLIVERQLWELLDIVSEQEDLHDFGLKVGLEINIQQQLNGMMPRLMAQPTLLGVLQAFCLMVNEESSDAQFWLAPSNHPDRHWFCRAGVAGINVGERDAELYTLMFMIKLVQLLTGEHWQPDSIQLKTGDERGLSASEIFKSNNFELNQSSTAIEIPSYFVNKQFFGEFNKLDLSKEINGPIDSNPIATDRLSESLKEVLSLYLSDERFDLEHAAELLGVSSRTLQRQLAKESTSYAQLVDAIKFNSAIPLLKSKSYKLVDIAFDLGYSDPAHFSRAFKRWAGITPREFRRNLNEIQPETLESAI